MELYNCMTTLHPSKEGIDKKKKEARVHSSYKHYATTNDASQLFDDTTSFE
jgi:hypothetical protein